MGHRLDIAVVTSAWGTYGRYLPEWARSVADQSLKPTQAVIIDAGIKHPKPLWEATAILQDAGIPGSTHHIPYTTMGAARNAAVAHTNTEWCMHLDADDTLLPHAISDVANVAAIADVVSIGAIRNGKPVVFPTITAAKILAGKHGMFSCGAFRRRFWEQHPWHTHNDWIDSTFWVGLAHLGARFVSTRTVGFNYRQHRDSISHTLTAEDRAAATAQWKNACREWTLN